MEKYTMEEQIIIDKLNEMIKNSSLTKAAKLIGISVSTLSEIRTGSYKGDIKKQIKRLKEYFDIKDERESSHSNAFQTYIPTSISEDVKKYIRLCQTRGRLVAISGDAGIGKTRAIRNYVEQNVNSTVWITANPCMNTVKSVLREIAKKLNIQMKSNNSEIYFSILSKLSDGMVIIIDEAQHLSIKVIEVLRGFSDYFEDKGQTLGICFVGNSTTINNFGVKEDAVFEQIANRTFQKPIFKTKDITMEDMEALFPLIQDKKALIFLHKIAQSKEAVRGAMNLYVSCVDNERYSFDDLVSMSKAMMMNI